MCCCSLEYQADVLSSLVPVSTARSESAAVHLASGCFPLTLLRLRCEVLSFAFAGLSLARFRKTSSPSIPEVVPLRLVELDCPACVLGMSCLSFCGVLIGVLSSAADPSLLCADFCAAFLLPLLVRNERGMVEKPEMRPFVEMSQMTSVMGGAVNAPFGHAGW